MNEEIKRKIQSHKIVTFDVFDTLIKRDVLTFKNISEIINYEYKCKYNKKLPMYFCRERIHSPKPARRKYRNKEVNLDMMYEVIHIPNKDEVKNMEIDTEIRCATPNPAVFDIYNYCKQQGKQIYAISDMYLPKSCIRKMLEKCGYEIDKIYVSQEYNATKVSGELFEKFMDEENYLSSDIIHIGDNHKADILGAKKNGIEAIQVKNVNDNPHYIKKGGCVRDNILYKFINNRVDSCNTQLEKVGYEVIGPLLYYFSRWLHTELKKNEIERVFFLSRDGFLLKKAYEYLYGKSEKVIYLHVSSKSVKNALENIENQKQEFIQYLKQMNFEGKVAIVDIGWSGNLHRMIKDVSKEFADVYGFYFGTFSKFKKNVTDGVSCGFLNENRYTRAKIFMSAGFIEILFSDTKSGTVERYESNNDKTLPITSEANPNGKYLEQMQMGALKFVDDWDKSIFKNIQFTPHKLIAPMLYLSINPRIDDVKELADDYVGSGKKYQKLAGADNKKYHLSNIKELMEDMKAVAWKGGFFKKNFNHSIVNKIYEIFNPILIFFKV